MIETRTPDIFGLREPPLSLLRTVVLKAHLLGRLGMVYRSIDYKVYIPSSLELPTYHGSRRNITFTEIKSPSITMEDD